MHSPAAQSQPPASGLHAHRVQQRGGPGCEGGYCGALQQLRRLGTRNALRPTACAVDRQVHCAGPPTQGDNGQDQDRSAHGGLQLGLGKGSRGLSAPTCSSSPTSLPSSCSGSPYMRKEQTPETVPHPTGGVAAGAPRRRRARRILTWAPVRPRERAEGLSWRTERSDTLQAARMRVWDPAQPRRVGGRSHSSGVATK